MNKRSGQGTEFRDSSFKVEQCNSKATGQLQMPHQNSATLHHQLLTTLSWSKLSLGDNLKSSWSEKYYTAKRTHLHYKPHNWWCHRQCLLKLQCKNDKNHPFKIPINQLKLPVFMGIDYIKKSYVAICCKVLI